MLNSDTLIIYKKYTFFLDVLFEDRFCIFYDESDSFYDHEAFFNARMNIIDKHYTIKNEWLKFKRQRHNMMKRFEIQTIIIKRRGYVSMLLNVFCRDLTNVIIEFLM